MEAYPEYWPQTLSHIYDYILLSLSCSTCTWFWWWCNLVAVAAAVLVTDVAVCVAGVVLMLLLLVEVVLGTVALDLFSVSRHGGVVEFLSPKVLAVPHSIPHPGGI